MSRLRRATIALLAGLGLFFAAGACQASCNALAVCTCTVGTTGVSFGSYSVTATGPDDATGSVTVTCLLTVAKAGSFTLALSTGASNSFSARALKSGANSLAYNLYTTDARTQVVGDGTGGTATLTGSIGALLTSITTLNLYGRLPAGQNVPNGSYSDSLIVTITY